MNQPPQVTGPTNGSEEAGRAVRHLSLMAAGRISTQTVLIISALVIPTVLGTEEFGRYAAVVAAVAMLEVVGSGGLHLAELRFFAPAWRSDRARGLAIGSSLWTTRLGLSAAVAFVAAAWMAVSPISNDSAAMVIAVAVLVGTRSAFEATRQLFLSLGRVGVLASLEFLRVTLTLLVVVATFRLSGLRGVFVSLAIAMSALLVLAVVVLRRTAPISTRQFDWPTLRPLLGFGAMTLVGMVAWIVQAQFPVYAVANWVSLSDAALVAVTVQVYVLGQTLLLSPWSVVTPILAELDASGQQDRLREWCSVIMRWSTATAVVASLTWAIAGDVVLSVLPDAFAPAHASGTVALASLVLLASTASTNRLLYASGYAGTGSVNQIAFATVTVGGTVFLISSDASNIALSLAWVYVASAGVFAVAAYVSVLVRKSMRLPLRRTLAIASPVLLAWPAQAWEGGLALELIALVVLIAAYIGTLIGFGLLPLHEIRLLGSAARRPKSGAARVDQPTDAPIRV